jgi:hypothetical protein
MRRCVAALIDGGTQQDERDLGKVKNAGWRYRGQETAVNRRVVLFSEQRSSNSSPSGAVDS